MLVYVYSQLNEVAVYLAKFGGSGECNQLYMLNRPVGAVEELLSLDLGFGHIAPQHQDVEILSDEEDPADFGPNHISAGVMHGGFASHLVY